MIFSFKKFFVAVFILGSVFCLPCANAADLTPASAETVSENKGKMASVVQGKLVVPLDSTDNKFVPYQLSAPYEYYLVYFSAHWCGPCKKFTPKLVDYYKEKQLSANGVQVIFISRDFTERDMWKYMTGAKMPWPALGFDYRDRIDFFNRLAGSGIPDLLLLSASGEVVASAYDGGKYLGPQVVLDRLSEILKKKAETASSAPVQLPAPKTTQELQKALDMSNLPE